MEEKLYVVEIFPGYERFEMCVAKANSSGDAVKKVFEKYKDYTQQEELAVFEIDLDSDGVSNFMSFTI